MNQHLTIRSLAQKERGRNLNEADTRFNIIDSIVHDVLDWPKTAVKRELSISPGFADYVLYNAANLPALVIEAKREGSYFKLPNRKTTNPNAPEYLSMRSLLTDAPIKEAISQARTYCLDIGCAFGCITNGHEWIIFRAFEQGADWKSLRAFVLPSLDSIDENFTQIFNSLSYRRVSFDGSLNELISKTPLENRETYRPGDEITAYTRTIQSNKYVQYLRPIAERFFGQIDAKQLELMNECYVSDPSYESTFKAAESILFDSLTPYLESYGVKETKNTDGGGSFGSRLEKSVTREARADVVVLFGGKGIGKSTFLRRLLFTKPPQILKKNSVIALVDLLSTPEDKPVIEKKIWETLITQMDTENILNSDREKLSTLFNDRFEIAEKQDLYNIPKDSLEYNKTLNSLISDWKKDHQYVAQKLGEHLKRRHKGVIVVIDNTDQFRGLQEYCFTHAQSIANTLKCLVIISMREERFYASTIHGVLDAFQNSGFHLSSPSPQDVFLKRINYVLRLLNNKSRRSEIIDPETTPETITAITALLRNLRSEFQSNASHLSGFLTACAHGNIRLALELFRGLIQSRYTNIDEITSKPDWTWQIHQVLKPVMIPNRFFYEESESHVPNIFQLRNKKRSSHFTTQRILGALVSHSESRGSSFVDLPQLLTEHSNRFHMEEDTKATIDMLLRYGLIEANNRIDEYADSIDSIRATPYGRHLQNQLSSAFTYIDLVSTDTAICDSRVSSELARLSTNEFEIWETPNTNKAKRIERVEARIMKAKEFADYLQREEEREAELYGLSTSERFVPHIQQKLDEEILRVRRSANRQRY